MSAKSIVTIDQQNENLTRPAKAVTDFATDELKNLIRDLIDSMKKSDGIGIAAPQINVSQQVIIVNTDSGPLSLINPKIIARSIRREDGEEGCLSVPGVYGIVPRHRKIRVTGYDIKGNKQMIKAEGLFARVLQHEIDHINGILFIKKTKEITRGKESLTI
ncbi:MAG: peptide deformylase [Patescibacteria group bacterium]